MKPRSSWRATARLTASLSRAVRAESSLADEPGYSARMLGDVATDPVGQHAQPVGQELFQVEQDVRGTQAGRGGFGAHVAVHLAGGFKCNYKG
ncbi:hypothetical protein G6F40_017711 [Rhizopus arrhizus]|nr:hypothetical protein G6F40_017711 [Rhizopus arrhizus]